MKTGVPQISKRVSKLEDLLGVALLQRSTRVVNLTDEGKALLPKVTAILEDLASLEAGFEGGKEISGTIRIASVSFVAHRLLLPAITKFKMTYPNVKIDLDLSEGLLNLLEANIDLAIRIEQEPEDSSLVYRKLAANELVLCASPKYLERNKSPLRTPRDLKHHELLTLDIHEECAFLNNSIRLKELANSKKITCSNGWFLTQLALEGWGILVRSRWDVQEHLKNGALVQVLKKHPLENFGHIYAVIPSRRFLAPRVRKFLDFIVEQAEVWKL